MPFLQTPQRLPTHYFFSISLTSTLPLNSAGIAYSLLLFYVSYQYPSFKLPRDCLLITSFLCYLPVPFLQTPQRLPTHYFFSISLTSTLPLNSAGIAYSLLLFYVSYQYPSFKLPRDCLLITSFVCLLPVPFLQTPQGLPTHYFFSMSLTSTLPLNSLGIAYSLLLFYVTYQCPSFKLPSDCLHITSFLYLLPVPFL